MRINRKTTNSTTRQQGGFTLLELLVSIVLLVVIVGTAVLFGIATVRSEATFMETARLDTRRGGLSALLRDDLDLAGHGLTKLKEPGAGTETLSFIPNPTFSQSGDTLTALTAQARAEAARAIGAGTGAVAVTYPGSGSFTLSLPVGAAAYSINVTPSAWTATFGSSPLANSGTSGFAPQADDNYQIAIERCSTGLCISFYLTRSNTSQLLYSGVVSTLTYPIAPEISLSSNSHVSGVSLTGAPLIDVQAVATLIPPMPFRIGSSNRLAGAVSSNAARNELTIIAGDSNTDPVLVTNHDVVSSSLAGPDQGVNILSPRRGTFQINDIIMLVDFNASTTALFRVRDTTVDQTTNEPVLTLSGVTAGHPAWGSFFSTDSERAHTFPIGSLLVKLAPPIQWSLQGTDLFRKTGNDPWQVAEFGVSQFLVDETLVNGRRTYQVSISLNSEQVEVTTGTPVSTFDIVATPRALNLTYNPQT